MLGLHGEPTLTLVSSPPFSLGVFDFFSSPFSLLLPPSSFLRPSYLPPFLPSSLPPSSILLPPSSFPLLPRLPDSSSPGASSIPWSRAKERFTDLKLENWKSEFSDNWKLKNWQLQLKIYNNIYMFLLNANLKVWHAASSCFSMGTFLFSVFIYKIVQWLCGIVFNVEFVESNLTIEDSSKLEHRGV